MMKRRDEVWANVRGTWDVVVIGGGITGAGVFAHASRLGLKCLLIEQRDFAWGTSSRSGKLVHGGLRYLKQGQVRMTFHSVREREGLLRLYPGMIHRLGFLMPVYDSDRASRLLLKTGLALYDGMAGRLDHRWLGASELETSAPVIRSAGLVGGYRFEDAQTDDARLVWRVMDEGRAWGGTCLNYAAALSIEKGRAGKMGSVTVEDALTGQIVEVEAPVIVNAAGIWVDGLRTPHGLSSRTRKLRGSHLLFPHWRFPLSQAVSFAHPEDGRPVYAVPWEGVTLFGTTDVDHDQPLGSEPHMAPAESDYLFAALDSVFPSLNLSLADVLSVYSGVRSVIDTGKSNPSDESREHAIWVDRGVVSVIGGKLTTYRLLAAQTLVAAEPFLRRASHQSLGASGAQRSPDGQRDEKDGQSQGIGISPLSQGFDGQERVWRRLKDRYGRDTAATLWHEAAETEREVMANTDISLAELKWAARREDVVHLEDLLLRRTRLGLVTEQGGLPLLPRLRTALQSELGWTDDEWRRETERYRDLWVAAYSVQPMAAASTREGGVDP